jgi:hypothetical protein
MVIQRQKADWLATAPTNEAECWSEWGGERAGFAVALFQTGGLKSWADKEG